MKALLQPASRLLWAFWGLVAWSYALSLLVFMRGFFPPGFEAALGARIPLAALGTALTAWGAGPLRGLAAAAGAAACIALSPAGGGGGRAALASAFLAWAPFFAAGSRTRPEDPPLGLGRQLHPAALAFVLALSAWAATQRVSWPGAAALTALLLPLAFAAAAAEGLPGRLRRASAGAAAAWVLYRALLAPLGLTGGVAVLLTLPAG
ncbi:MAG: hypothetical protein HYV15_01010, partial [Elusimicrobia bacterium]|nr:hypothetical protein [Elusimicrobiota bacterium]